VTGEAAGAATVSVLTYHAAGTLRFNALDFSYLSDNSVVDVPVEAMFPSEELYVNCGPPGWHNHCRDATRRATVPDATSVLSTYGCSQKDGMC